MNPKQLLFVFLTLLALHCKAKTKAVTVLYPSYWTLVDVNSWKGRPRNSVQITLPPHTMKLVYILSSVGDNELEFTRFVKDAGRTTFNYQYKHYKGRKYLAEYLEAYHSGNPEDSIKAMPFLQPVDTVCTFGAYLFTDSLNTIAFNKGKPTECVNVYSFPKIKGTMVSIDMIDDVVSNNMWLGFANSSAVNPVHVMLEVAAIVNVPEDTVASVVLTEEQQQKKNAGFKAAFFPGQRSVPSYIFDNMNNLSHITNKCVQIGFQINEKGAIHDTQILAGGDYELDAEMIRVFNEMPLWTPATQDGVPVNSHFYYNLCD